MTEQKNIDRPAASEILEKFLKDRKMRRTPERFAILDMALGMPRHFFIDTLCECLERGAYHVSRATVYNTVQILVEAGILRRHQFAGQQSRFEVLVNAPQPNHLHLICLNCGKVKEVKDIEMAQKLDGMKFRGFAAQYFTLYVYGTCSACKKLLRKKSATSTKS